MYVTFLSTELSSRHRKTCDRLASMADSLIIRTVSDIFTSLLQTVAAADMSQIRGNLVEISAAASTIIGAPNAEA